MEVSHLKSHIHGLEDEVQRLRATSASSNPNSTAPTMLEEENKNLKNQVALLEDQNQAKQIEISQLREFEIANLKSRITSLEKDLEEKIKINNQQGANLTDQEKAIKKLESQNAGNQLVIMELREVSSSFFSFLSAPPLSFSLSLSLSLSLSAYFLLRV